MKHNKTLSLPIAETQHREIKRTAAERGVSMTALVVGALERAGVLALRDAASEADAHTEGR